MKKRIISILLVICMGLTLMPATVLAASLEATSSNVANLAESGPTTTFKDVSKSDWFYSSVQYALEHNIFNGTGKDTFSPYGTVTRGMYVTVLGRIAGVNPSEYQGKVDFKDVAKDAYYAPYVAWAVKKGITAGVDNNRFDPDGIVTREQMAVFTVKYFEVYEINYGSSTDVTTTPGDLASVSGWAKEAVLKLWKAGLLKGDNHGNFNPKSYTTRAETASFSVRTAEKAGITPTPPPRTVSFNSNGGTDVASVTVASGGKLSNLPSPQKTNAVFMGWFVDPGFQGNKFSEEDTINSNMTLYAKYMDIEAVPEKDEDEFYSLADQVSSLTFSVVASDSSLTADTVKSGITLEIQDGSKPISLVVNGSNGAFSVAADGGFTEGATYKLTLNSDGLSFSGKKDTIRTCSFNIKKQESFDIEFNEGMIYIPGSDLSNIIKNGQAMSSLSVPLVEVSNGGVGKKGSNTGSFTYKGSKALKADDVLCVYSGAKPKAGDDAPYLNEDIAYIKVTDVSGTTVRFGDADSKEVLFQPDVLPIYAGENNKLTNYLPTATSGSFSISKSDLDFSKFSAMGLNAETKIDKGDFVALYTSADLAQAKGDVIYGKVTAVTSNVDTVNVTYTRVTVSEMQQSNDYYSQNDIKGHTLLKDTNATALQEKIEKQVQASNFANRAAVYMASIAESTDGFKQLTATSGTKALTPNLATSAPTIEMKDPVIPGATVDLSQIKNLKVTVSVSTKTKKLKDGIRCSVDVSFSVPVDIDDDNKVNINLSATFVEEVKMSMTSSAEDEWDYLWGFIPYISEYNVNANIDVYDYTGITFTSTITSGKTIIDISKQIQNILSSTDAKKITSSVHDLFDTYSDMMKKDADWITIFETVISKNETTLLLGLIMIDTTIKFVASAEINVAFGCNFDYQCGTRYCFWAKLISMDAGSSTVDLQDETYTFKLYFLGSLGLRVGINLSFAIGLFSTDLDSIGLTAEAGVYTRFYGYFYYELKSVNGVKTSSKSGSIYFELGAYLKITFEAQVISGTFSYNPTLLDKEWPLWTCGDRYEVFDFAYKDTKTEPIKLKNKDRIYAIPDAAFYMTYIDLHDGDITKKAYPISDFDITFSDENFDLKGKNVVVKVPDDDTHILKCDVTLTWKDAPLAFSSVPIARTIHLQWDEIDEDGYTIYFDSNGGSKVSSITKQYDAPVTAPDAPTKTGYTFNGWYSDKQLTKLYTSTKMGWGNIILYAKWKPNTNTAYKVKHYQQNVTDGDYTLYQTEDLTGTTGDDVTPNVKDYTGFTAPSTQTVTVTADGSQVVNYRYTRNSYTLTFNANGGSGGTSSSVKYGASISAPAVSKTGFTFNGWNSAVSGTMPAADTTYTAQWSANTYTVQFDSNSGSSCSSIYVSYGSTYGVLPIPARAGYTFNGWYTSETGNNGTGNQIMSTTIANITSAQTLYANWTANTNTAYTVKHYQQNVADNNYTLYETGNLTGTTGVNVTPAVNSYSGFTAPSTQTVTIKADGSTVVNYYYTRNSYMLTFDANGGTGGNAAQVKYGAAIAAPAVTKTGYTFASWSPAVAGTMPAQDTTYMAQWTANNATAYKVEHYQQNIEDNNYTLAETENLNGTTGATATATAKSYTGFTYDSNVSGTVGSGTIAADGGLVLKIYYTRNSYTLTFDSNGGTGGSAAQVKYGAAIAARAVTKTGYTFASWSPAVAGTMPAQGTTYTAQWAIVNFKIRFDGNPADAAGSMADQSFSGAAAQNLTANGYTRNGYTFTGWNTAADGSGTRYENKASVSSLTTVNNDTVILYAQWKLSLSSGIFNSQYSAKYQVFDFIITGTRINGNAYDSSWGSAGASGGHQFSDAMLAGRYFVIRKTGDATNPIALYMYETDGTPVVQGTSANLYPSSLIGSNNNVNLTASCRTSLFNTYGNDWVKGLVAVGTISSLWDEGFQFTSANGFGYFISGTTAYSTTGAITLHNQIPNPSIAQIEAVTDFEAGPLTAPN